jgi:hypothetical protein
MFRLRYSGAMLALMLGAAGCGLLGGRSQAVPREGNLTLNVKNQNYYDATLYALYQSRRQQIGTVSGMSERAFSLDWGHPDIRIEIYLLSVGSHFTQPMFIDAGDELELVIDPSLDKRIRLRRR